MICIYIYLYRWNIHKQSWQFVRKVNWLPAWNRCNGAIHPGISRGIACRWIPQVCSLANGHLGSHGTGYEEPGVSTQLGCLRMVELVIRFVIRTPSRKHDFCFKQLYSHFDYDHILHQCLHTANPIASLRTGFKFGWPTTFGREGQATSSRRSGKQGRRVRLGWCREGPGICNFLSKNVDAIPQVGVLVLFFEAGNMKTTHKLETILQLIGRI